MKRATFLSIAAALLFVGPQPLWAGAVPAHAGRFLTAASRAQTEAPKTAKKKQRKSRFLRVRRDENGVVTAMQTSIVRYVPAQGKGDYYVDLVGVVHIADKGYYRKLNQKFKEYDVVLYELVAPKGVRPMPGRKSNNPLAMIQKMMSTFLQLDYQTEHIDYSQPNFVHADLSPAQMAEKMKARGESPLTIALSVAAEMIRQSNLQQLKNKGRPDAGLNDLDLLAMLADPNAPLKLKRMMAEQMAQLGTGSGLGVALDRLLITDRNEACIAVLKKQLKDGKKKIAIFYGAAHMPDFDRRLRRDFGLRRSRTVWLTAWDLRPGRGGANFFDLLRELQKQP